MATAKARTILAMRIVLVLFTLTLIVISPARNMEPFRNVTIYTGDGVLKVLTDKTLVADILAEADVKIDAQERTSPRLDQELASNFIIVEKARLVGLNVDGQEMAVYSWAKTVEELLLEQDIVLAGEDIVNLPMAERLLAGRDIEIIRVVREVVSEEAAIAAKTKYKYDSSLAFGKQKVQTEARDGRKQITYEVVYHDGNEVSRSVVSEKVLVEQITGIIVKGTLATASRGSGSAVEGIASYYGSELHGSKTASGVPFDMYALTAAHKTLPFGTKVKVTYLATGKSVVVEINDRGPFIPGRIIDLSAAAAKQIGLYADGIGKVKLEVLD